jgi:hypothetical protein
MGVIGSDRSALPTAASVSHRSRSSGWAAKVVSILSRSSTDISLFKLRRTNSS